jgi:hypothetical protein
MVTARGDEELRAESPAKRPFTTKDTKDTRVIAGGKVITYHKGTKYSQRTQRDKISSFVPFLRPSCPFGPSPQGEAFVVFMKRFLGRQLRGKNPLCPFVSFVVFQ